MPKVLQPSVNEYWQGVYAATRPDIPTLPSQFAVFAAGEMPARSMIVDVGCGNGRDSFLFARHGHSVVAMDASSAAIASCVEAQSINGLNVSFLCLDICSGTTMEHLRSHLSLLHVETILVYSRFFLHAVPAQGESALFALTRELTQLVPNTSLAVEFRTVRDAAIPKRTASHYRRFVDPLRLIAQAARQGFSTDYFVEGFGFAKYGTEDAHVARCIFSI